MLLSLPGFFQLDQSHTLCSHEEDWGSTLCVLLCSAVIKKLLCLPMGELEGSHLIRSKDLLGCCSTVCLLGIHRHGCCLHKTPSASLKPPKQAQNLDMHLPHPPTHPPTCLHWTPNQPIYQLVLCSFFFLFHQMFLKNLSLVCLLI